MENVTFILALLDHPSREESPHFKGTLVLPEPRLQKAKCYTVAQPPVDNFFHYVLQGPRPL